MRFIIMHKTNAHRESGAIPSKELIGRVGTLLGRLAREGVLVAGEGLRASSEGVRLRFAAGTRTLVNGPFQGDNELAAGFSVVRTPSLEDAIEWATRQREVGGTGIPATASASSMVLSSKPKSCLPATSSCRVPLTKRRNDGR